MIRYYSVPKETFVTNGTIVEPLTATENGTYAPPAGTAYSPVIVNVEGGGGGSSDFSTAEVTIINNTSAEGYIRGAVTIEAEGEQPACTLYDIYYEANKTITDNLVLYKGGAVIEIQGINPLISGNIESLGDHMYLVTGDGTITIS